MTWSLQITLWVLPPLLAALLAARDLGFLWPRRREQGTRALLALATTTLLWAVLDVLGGVTPSLGTKLLMARLEYLPAALAPVTWAWFALVHTQRRQNTALWPMGLLLAASLATAVVALGAPDLLIRTGSLTELGGARGLQIDHGLLHWETLATRAAAVLWATWILSRSLVRSRRSAAKTAMAGLAGTVALAPALAHALWTPRSEWTEMSSLGFALGGALLVWGLVRPDILNLGPVDREVVLRDLRDPLVVMDGRGRIVDANRAARDHLGLTPYGSVPVTLGTLWATGPAPEGTPPARIVLDPDARAPQTFEVTLTPLGEGAGAKTALLLRDITVREEMSRALKEANAELEERARTDSLTGLANRRHFMEVLAAEVERSQRYQRPLSLVLLDLDHFKRVNDTYGHAAGDDVLRAAAESLRSVCRDVDLAARLGGEELALILPETDVQGAHVVAERVRRKIETATHQSPAGDAFAVTASMGVATANPDTVSGEALLQASDEALYKAKDGGRNRVVLAS